MGFPRGSVVKNPLAMQETQVRSLGQEEPLEEGLATHSNILAWRILWAGEPGKLYTPWGHKESDMTEATEHACMHMITLWSFHNAYKCQLTM